MAIKRRYRASVSRLKSNHDCGKPSPQTVVWEDRNGEPFTFGSIVEIIPWDGKARARGYVGLWFVREFVTDERGKIRVRVSKESHGLWDLSVEPICLSTRCFKPHRGKGE